jgi:DNA-binding response OmpR family regulator
VPDVLTEVTAGEMPPEPVTVSLPSPCWNPPGAAGYMSSGPPPTCAPVQPAARTRILRAAGIELDPAARTATRDGRSLDLSVKEFAVLEAMLHASPAFLSAEDLLEKAWDENADPFTNTVTVTISRLRRKLGDPPVITTTPGVGYRIATQTPYQQSPPAS